jgi:hypothetical protein
VPGARHNSLGDVSYTLIVNFVLLKQIAQNKIEAEKVVESFVNWGSYLKKTLQIKDLQRLLGGQDSNLPYILLILFNCKSANFRTHRLAH